MANTHISIAPSRHERWMGLFYLIFQLTLLPWLLNWANHAIGSPLGSAWLNFLFFGINSYLLPIYLSFIKLNELGCDIASDLLNGACWQRLLNSKAIPRYLWLFLD